MRYWLVMPAAGTGRRFGTGLPKQYASLEGRTVIEWALAPFLADPRCVHAVVAVAPGDPHWGKVAARLAAAAATAGAPKVTSVTGGEERARSVRLRLAALPARAGAGGSGFVHHCAR